MTTDQHCKRNYARKWRSVGSGRRLADTSGERLVQTIIMFARLPSKAKQREKDKRACNKRPARHLEVERQYRVIPPNKACNLLDLGIVAVHASPTLPRYNTQLRIGHEVVRPQWDGPKYLHKGYNHQAEVPATIGSRNQLHMVLSALVERVNGHS